MTIRLADFFISLCFIDSLLHRPPPPPPPQVGAAGSTGGCYWNPASGPASLWRVSRREGSFAEVGLEPVHAHDLGSASNLEAQELLVERRQGRYHPSPAHVHELGLLKLLEAGGCLRIRQLSRGKGCMAFSSSTTFSTGVSGTARSWPGSVSGIPKTNSAEKRPLSSLGAALMHGAFGGLEIA
jgi:hypothetical protein